MEAKFLFRPCASIAPSLESRVGRGHEKSTIENDQKRNGLLNMPRLRTMEELKRNGNEERLGGEIGRRAKGKRRRITKESDWRQKRGETKARMPAF
eukprot:COSAG02_NODE_1718_length_11207_cov_2.888999_13_plen_96_part_00